MSEEQVETLETTEVELNSELYDEKIDELQKTVNDLHATMAPSKDDGNWEAHHDWNGRVILEPKTKPESLKRKKARQKRAKKIEEFYISYKMVKTIPMNFLRMLYGIFVFVKTSLSPSVLKYFLFEKKETKVNFHRHFLSSAEKGETIDLNYHFPVLNTVFMKSQAEKIVKSRKRYTIEQMNIEKLQKIGEIK